MNILLFLIPLSLLLGVVAFGGFIWALRHAQFDDLEGDARRILIDDENKPK